MDPALAHLMELRLDPLLGQLKLVVVVVVLVVPPPEQHEPPP